MLRFSEKPEEIAPRRAKMKPQGLNKLRHLRQILVWLKRQWFVRAFGMDIDPTVELSLSARLDRTYPSGVHVGANSYIAFEAAILTHDRTRGLYLHTRIGRDCFIGARSIVLPGVQIGDGSIVGAGSVVTRDVAPRTIVAGNPARVVSSQAATGRFGRLISADQTEAELAAVI